jgi:transposase
MARTPGSGEYNERKRRRAIELVFKHKRTQIEAAREVKSALRTVQRWVSLYRKYGDAGLKSRKATGRPKKLTASQLKKLERILLKGATKAGFANDLWTSKRVLGVLEREFGVVFHHNHVPKLLVSMGWSAQRPQREAAEKDQKKIDEWVRRDWKRIKKKPD